MFKDKVLLITGGTGSFGNAILRRFLNSDKKKLESFSRDERNKMICVSNWADKVKFYIVMYVIIKALLQLWMV